VARHKHPEMQVKRSRRLDIQARLRWLQASRGAVLFSGLGWMARMSQCRWQPPSDLRWKFCGVVEL
jgi:hypothetical protein